MIKEKINKEKNDWLPQNDTFENKLFNRRTPGLFKEEFIGKGIVALSSKMYYVKGFDKKDKLSAKGIQKSHNGDILNYEAYKNVLLNDVTYNAVNKGMRIFNDKQILKVDSEVNENRKIYTYSMEKMGLTQKYDKRIVLEDGISTIPLNM